MKNIDSRMVVRELLTSVPVPGAHAAAPSADGAVGQRGGILRGRRTVS
jgi:hypothetical protein